MIATAIEIHPLALRVPAMTDEEFRALRDDIAANGLLRPITMFEGMVLDGRHRLRACGDTETEPEFEEYGGDSPAAFVLALNAKRRNLTTGQLAMLATDFLPDLAEEAKRRQREHGGTAPGRPSDTSRSSAGSEGESREAAEEAAGAVGVSPRAVYQAKRVLKEDPQLAEQVRAGEIAIDTAHKKVASTTKPEDGKRLPQAIVRVATTLNDLVASLDGIALRKSVEGLSASERETAAESFKNAGKKFNSIARLLAEGSAS